MSMSEFLPFIFVFVAMVYSSVGLGGGSSYTALMTVAGLSYRLIPTTSLTLNLLVTMVAMISFWRGGHVKWSNILPFLVTSIPLAYVGGALNISREVFLWLLLATLVLVAGRIYLLPDLRMTWQIGPRLRLMVALVLGALLGFVAGTVGIGGGIFLVPVMIMLGLASEKQAAATGAVFIWVNSLSGLIARYQRGAFDFDMILPLAVAVVLGALLGSHMGAFRFKPQTVQRVLGVVVLVAIVFIGRKVV